MKEGGGCCVAVIAAFVPLMEKDFWGYFLFHIYKINEDIRNTSLLRISFLL